MGNKEDKPFVGVDLGGTNIQAGVVTAKHEVISRGKSKTKAAGGADEVIKRIGKTVDEALSDAKLSPKDVGGLGIGAPGAIDIKEGLVLNAPNLRWTRYPLADELAKKLEMPVTVDNDVNVGTWGEHVAGAGQNHDSMLGVFVGTGIGGGIVLDRQLFHGHHHTAGEIGHVIIQADAPLGRRTLENLASRTAIADHLRKLIEANHDSELTAITDGDLTAIRSKALAEALKRKDGLAEQVIRQAAVYVGTVIANLVTVLSLPCAVLGGGLTSALGENWVQWVRDAFEQRVFPAEMKVCKILAGKLDDDAGVIGAADLARRRL